MATSIQVKRGTTAKVAAYTPLEGELVLDLTTKKLYAGDGSTAGGNQIVASRKGVTDGSSASAGEIGESVEATKSGVAVTSGVSFNAVSITLGAGVWDLTGVLGLSTSDAPITVIGLSTNTVSATGAGFPYGTQISLPSIASNQRAPLPVRIVNITSSTTYYLVGTAAFSTGTVTASGYLYARRIR